MKRHTKDSLQTSQEDVYKHRLVARLQKVPSLDNLFVV